MGSEFMLGVESAGAVSVARPAIPDSSGRIRRPFQPIRGLGQVLRSLPLPAWILLDAAVLWIALIQGYAWFDLTGISKHTDAWLAYAVCATCLTTCSLIFGLNERATLYSRWHIVTRMLLTSVLGAILAYAIIYVGMYASLSRRIAALAFITYLVTGLSIRLLACYAIHSVKRKLVVVGSRKSAEAFVGRLDGGFLSAHEVMGFVNQSAAEATQSNLPGLGSTDELVGICRQMDVKDIVVCNGAQREKMTSWMLPCLRLGCRVTNEATFHETCAGQILVDEITPDWFLVSDLKAHCDEYASLKRLFDIAVASVGLLVSLPLYPILALLIKLEDRGPVFYAQDRVGKNGTIFKLFKFRTMKTDAENGESVWAKPNDPRTTRIGRFMRRTRLDELPQFYNILLGQMTVVGPRPERPDIQLDLCKHIPYWSERNLVKPGLTGWAQISFRYGSTIEDAKRKLQFDLYYLKHMNLELDVIILFRTLGTFLRGAC
ncbi:MAG: sugar transferase [Planctomycetes bacterium]|nr:sugar transferase [Planctomycetota bacterium]